MILLKTLTTPLVDAVSTKPINDTLEILSKVDQFYNSAWDKLLVFGAIIGILVPFVISYYQKQVLKASEKELEAQYNLKITELQTTLEKELNLKFEKKLTKFKNEIDERLDKINSNADASVFHIQANNAFDKEYYDMAIRDFLYAAEGYTKSEDYANVRATLHGIKNCVDNLKKEDIENLKIIHSIELIQSLEKIDFNNAGGAFFTDVREIKSKIHKILNPQQ